MEIKRNLIVIKIHWYCKGDLKKVERVVEQIGKDLYGDRPKLWSRIKNNTSQPKLTAAASIARTLNVHIEDLFEFQTTDNGTEKK